MMYRIENYITSIILSKVDRYIKNFRREDVKVSLWKGDCVLYNLDLDLDVLEQELNLPFSLTSGHIHQLHIHVPWTRLNSESVQLTINTIECVMKLKSPCKRQPPPTPPTTKQVGAEESLAPSSYLTSLVNKILCNLSVTCNNLILKYVEEDIVLSMNIKTLSLTTVNSKWLSEFSELTTTDLILRKLISLTDVTICLDKRNASGRIESYLKPLLYKCSMVIRLSRSYPSVNSSNSSCTRIALHCVDFNLSISEPQVSMLLRLYFLTRMAFNQSKENSDPNMLSRESLISELSDEDSEMGWGSWLWGFVPTISPLMSDSFEFNKSSPPVNKFHLGLYIDLCTLDLKLSKLEEASDWESILQLVLGGCFLELTSNNSDWYNIQVGVCSANVSPVPNSKEETYLDCGEIPKSFYTSSLFANPDVDLTQRPWEYHLSTVTETLMMERAPTFYMDYISVVDKDHCYDSDDMIKDVKEKQLIRYVVGPICVSIGSELVDKLTILKQSLYSYDYSPYTQLSNLQVGALTADDIDLFKATVNSENGYYIPQSVSQFTFFGARIKIYPSDSSYLQHSSGASKGGPPYIIVKIKCLDGKLTRPMFPDKLSALSAHYNLPDNCIIAAHSSLSLLLVEARVGIVIRDIEGPDAFEISNLSWSGTLNTLTTNKTSADGIIKQSSIIIEKIMLFSTKPKLILASEIIFSLITNSKKNDLLYNTSLLRDCRTNNESVYLEMKLSDCECKYLLKRLSECGAISVGSLSASTMLTRGSHRETVISTNKFDKEDNLLEVVAQRPVGEVWNVAPLFSFKLSGLDLRLGRNLCLYIMYSPQTNHIRAFNIMQTSGSARKISTSSLSSFQKKQVLDQNKKPPEIELLPPVLINYLSNVSDKGFKLMSLVISGDISNCSLIFPGPSISNSNSSVAFSLSALSIRSPLGKINYNLKQLPIQIDNWNQNKINFPWSIFICEAEGFTDTNGNIKLPLLRKVNTTLTLALTTKHDNELNKVSAIALCLHIDSTPISVALSYQQVILVSEVFASLCQVYHSLIPSNGPVDAPCLPPPMSSTSPPPTDPANITKSDDSTSNSISTKTPVGSCEEVGNEDKVKVTLWLQCTVTKCTLALYSYPSKHSDQYIKYVLDIDDIFMTLDVVSVYQKMKLKIATAQIKHYSRLTGNAPWRSGCFSGIIMKGNETKSDNNDSDDFLSVTLTRASAANLHKKLNHNIKKLTKEFESGYVSEVVIKVQPLDFVLSPVVIGKILYILEPLLDQQDLFPLGRNYSTSPIYGQSVFNFTTSSLPLLYLDVSLFRLFLPTTGSHPTLPNAFDTIYLQVEKISLSSEAVNPVSRKFVRSELYERHSNRLTTIPGSCLEDRQYQLDSNITISTGKWCEVVKAIEEDEGVVGQNPAVYWNSAEDHRALHHTTSPLLNPLILTVIVAPPITTSGFIISGLNVEVNIVSEVDLSIDLEQVKLLTQLYYEAIGSFPGCTFQNNDNNISASSTNKDQVTQVSAHSDSGVESVDDSFQTAKKDLIEIPVSSVGMKSSSMSVMSLSTPTSVNTRRYHQRTQTVPIDVLITTKAIIMKLYRSRDEQCEPLFFILLSQPYVALEKQADVSIIKGSLYEMEMKHGDPYHLVDNGNIKEDSYVVTLVENKSGDADPDKGIPPALFNFKSTTQGIRPPTIDVEFGRPIKFLFKTSSIDYLQNLKNSLLQSLDLLDPLLLSKEGTSQNIKSSVRDININKKSTVESPDKKPVNQLKNYFHSCSIFSLNTKQIVLDFQTQLQPELMGCLLSIGSIKLSGEWSEVGCFSTQGQISSICMSVCQPDPRLIAGPWSFSIFLNRDHKVPSLCSTINAGLLTLDLSKESIETITSVWNEFKPYVVKNEQKQHFTSDNDIDEHHYKDDLQAGAFQFITSNSNTVSKNPLPLPYQVLFPTKKIMSWTYPAPRAITGVTVLPLPSNNPDYECDNIQISLEYYECGTWRHWLDVIASSFNSVEGIISSQDICKVSATWRAVIKSHSSPHSSVLATALRINSLYSPSIVPFLNLRIDLHSLQVSLWTKQGNVSKLEGLLSRYSPDSSLPSSYSICTLFLEPLQSFITYWSSGDIGIEVDLRPRLDVLNPRTLLQQCCLLPFSLSIKSSYNSIGEFRNFSPNSSSVDSKPRSKVSTDNSEDYRTNKQWQISLKSSQIIVRLAPPLCHTLLAASKGAVLTPYIICNDTANPIRFGQMGTIEDITLDSLSCNFYSWRSAKQQSLLRFSFSRPVKNKNQSSDSFNSLTLPDGIWSEGICPDEESIYRLELEDENCKVITLLVTIKHLSPILTQVIVGGQLLMYNMLDSSFVECRLVSSSISEVQRKLTLQPSKRAPSLTLSPNSKYSLRLSTVPNRWSGLIPLMTNNNVWMVKIPLEEKDQYISAWCQIVQEEESEHHPRLLVILSPIYLLRSYLPCESNVTISTKGFTGQVNQVVPGRGSTSNLKALGTATHQHKLDFSIEGVETEGGGGIALSYGLVEGRGPAPGPVPPLPTLLELADVQSHLHTDWPPIPALSQAHLSSSSWTKADQPNTLTHVKVKFGCDLLKVTNSLMVELQPWSLFINTTGYHIYLMKNCTTLVSLPHFSIVAPPQLQGSFKLGVDLETNGVHFSNDIELSQNQVFYMPQISGIVPISGQLNINITANDMVVCLTIKSSLSNSMRLLHACSTFIIINISSYDLSVAPLLVYREHSKLIVPKVVDHYSIPLPKQGIEKPSGVNLAKWYKIGECLRSEGKNYLFFEKDGHISSPVYISSRERQLHTVVIPMTNYHRCSDQNVSESSSCCSPRTDEKSSCCCDDCSQTSYYSNISLTVVVQTSDGLTYITIDDEPTPQLVIHNDTGVNLAVTKASPTRGGAGLPVDDFPDWDWKLIVPNNKKAHYFYGYHDPSKPLSLVLSRPHVNGWSNSISIVPSTSGRLVTLPQCHDLTAFISKRGSTIHLKLTPANQRIVAASDIRSRLVNIDTTVTTLEMLSSKHSDVPEESQDNQCCSNIENDNIPSESSSTIANSSIYDRSCESDNSINIRADLKNLTIILCSESPNSYQWIDVASLSMDNISVLSYPSFQKEDDVIERQIDVQVSEMQLDNEEYQRGGYDFGVVLLCKSNKETNEPALHLQLNFDYQTTPALQDVILKMSPMQAFVEDVYVTRLKEQMAKMLPEITIICDDKSVVSIIDNDEKDIDKEEIANTHVRRKTECSESQEGNLKEEDDELFNVSDSEAEQENKISVKECIKKFPSVASKKTSLEEQTSVETPSDSLPFPEDILFTALELSRPLRLRSFSLSPVSVTVSVHTSTRFYIALDNSPLHFSAFERKDLLTTAYRLGHALSLHYFLGAIYGTGWALGSVELLGAPAGLARSVGTGLKSFVTLPCRGAVDQGATGLFSGFLHGSASLVKHLTAGTVMSVTKLAGSWSRTLDRLTLQDDDLKYAEEMRRVRPEGLTQALKLGLTELGVNILGGVGGLAQKPLEYVASGNQSLASTLGLALVGVITRPLSGAAELLALTGQGLLAGAGWTDNHLPKHENGGRSSQLCSESRLRYSWKYLSSDEILLTAVDVSCCFNLRQDEQSCISLLTTQRLCIIDARDNLARSLDLMSIDAVADTQDPLRINIISSVDSNDVEVYSKRRIEEFIRDSGRSIRKSPSSVYSNEFNENSQRIDSTSVLLYLYLPTSSTRVYMLSLIHLAKRHRANLGFTVLSG